MTTDNTSNLNLTEADFDSIIALLKTHLQGQAEFSDYNFEGSGLSTIIRILAYTTHYTAFYANMLGTEMFLDSAELRKNVIQRAKELNYIPTSARAPMATLDVHLNSVPGSPDPTTIEKGTYFTTTVDNTTHLFSTTTAYSVPINGDSTYDATIDIYQGVYVANTFIYDDSQDRNVFEIPNQNIDTRFMTVTVKDVPSGSTFDTYTLYDNINGLSGESKVFFIEENENGLFQLYFGENIIGRKPQNGAEITITYLVTNGDDANSATSFSASATIGGASSFTITTSASASGGSEVEDTNSIKLLAPRSYQSQNRVVTANDYSTIILREYPNIQSVSVWGGETNVPPAYGKVFIAINPIDGVVFSQTYKTAIETNLKSNYGVVAMRPEIVDPDYIYTTVHTTVVYDANSATVTSGEIQQSVETAVTTFFTDTLGSFDTKLRFSKLIATIDNASTFIKSNQTELHLKKKFVPVIGSASDYTVAFSNSITPNQISTTKFKVGTTEVYIDDIPDGTGPYTTGTLRLYKLVSDVKVTVNASQGTVNYVTGDIVISSLTVASTEDASEPNKIVISANPVTSLTSGSADISEVDFNISSNNREQVIIADSPLIVTTIVAEN